MKIVCADGMPYVREAFSEFGDVCVLPGRAIAAADVRDADALMIRSTTKVTPALLEGSRVRFVATATIGTDHMDIPFLERRDIAWCSAPGCNANSVSEYIVAALLHLGQRHNLDLTGRTLGIIGVGRVGGKVSAKAKALGLRLVLNDPPRFNAEGNALFRPLDEVLAQSDILSLHVPLEAGGRYPTNRLADDRFFSRIKPGAILLNAARGPVVDTDALLRALQTGRVGHAVLDTWDPEPAFRDDLLAAVDIGTPHIAGYSFDGKVNGTLMVYREFCRFLKQPATWSPDSLLPASTVPHLRVQAKGRSRQDVMTEVVKALYDIEADDRALRARSASNDDAAGRAELFDSLRRNYPDRREWHFTRLTADGASQDLRDGLAGLGFVTD